MKNVGQTDKLIRLIIATGLILLYVTGVVRGTLGIILLVFAGIAIVTALINFCPLYCPLKINTRKKK